MAKSDRRFAAALKNIDRRALNDAFEFCNRQPDLESYDRTALGRWLDGSIPSRLDFVQCLADHLDDPTIFAAWLEAHDGSSSADVKAVVTRYLGLTPEDKIEAFQLIRDDLVATSPRIRSQFSMRIELHDSDDDNVYRLALAINWIGHLPAKAKTAIVTDYDELAEAFDQDDCVFRDAVELDEQLFDRALFHEDTSKHTLSYSRTGGDDFTLVTVEASMVDRGVYEFPNEELERARIRLRVSYPFPRGTAVYPIVFKSYQVAGPAVITLALYSERARDPTGLRLSRRRPGLGGLATGRSRARNRGRDQGSHPWGRYRHRTSLVRAQRLALQTAPTPAASAAWPGSWHGSRDRRRAGRCPSS